MLSFRGSFVELHGPIVGLLFGCLILTPRLWPLPGLAFHLIALALWFAVKLAGSVRPAVFL